MRYDIVPARIEDCAVISELIHALAQFEKLADQCEATPEKIRLALFGAAPAAHCLLAWEVDEELQTRKPAAFALYFFNFSTFVAKKGLYLEDLFVVPQARGKGLGTRMIERLGEIARKENCGRFEWVVLDWNASAQNFYRKLGARILKDWWICRLDESALEDLAQKRADKTAEV